MRELRNIISSIRESAENRRRKIASPYVEHNARVERERMLKFFQNSRQLDLATLLKRLDNIRYDKPWPEGTTLDQAFDLAVLQAVEITKEQLRK